jgi:hypothetical protein
MPYWTVSVSATDRVCVPDTPDSVTVEVAGGGAEVPPAEDSLLDPPPPLAGVPPPPQPTKELKNRSNPKPSKLRNSFLLLLPARNVTPNGITTALNRRSSMAQGDLG